MKVEGNQENVELCKDFCGRCLIYPSTNERLFDARGEINDKIKRKGCLYSAYQVYLDNNFKDDEF